MRKNDKKQRRSLLFSTAVVVTGCLLTAFYVNQEMPKSEYEVDLSQLSAEQKQEDLAGDMRTGDAGVAKVTGNDVQNPVIAAETDAEKRAGGEYGWKRNLSKALIDLIKNLDITTCTII